MKKKYKIILFFIGALIFVLCSILLLVVYNFKEESNIYGDVETALLPMVSSQKEVNERLDSISNDKQYTFNNAYVELDPYNLTPLSGIIIFNSDTEEEVKVYINDKYFTTMEASSKHVIPIYGLYEDMDNKIKLVMNNEEVTYSMVTSKSNIEYPVNVEVTSDKLNDDIYFTEGTLVTGLTGWDKDGNLRFYMSTPLKMDVEWLDNGHFIIGTPQGNNLNGGLALDRYMAFVEMDYLGKIYNYYTMANGFDFETQIMNDGTVMIGGGNDAIYYDEHVIYTFDMNTNKVVYSMNLSELIKSVDPDFDSEKLGPSGGKNGWYYNEDTDELVISLRNLDALISVQYKNPKINWVITKKDNKYFSNEVWNSYILESDFEPLGQHSPQILGDGLYGFFNNNYDRVDVKYDIESNEGKSSEAVIFKVSDGVATKVWSSSGIGGNYFSQKYGIFRVLDNGNRLIDYGWVLYDSYLADKNNTYLAAEGDVSKSYSVYLELDSEDNVLWKATCDEGKYRIFKHSLYNDTTSNVDINKYNIYENISKSEYTEIDSKDYDLVNTNKYNNYYVFTKNTFFTDYNLNETDKIEFLFISNDKSYKFNYKDSNNSNINKVFNLELPSGTYQFYIVINDTIYDTNHAYKF